MKKPKRIFQPVTACEFIPRSPGSTRGQNKYTLACGHQVTMRAGRYKPKRVLCLECERQKGIGPGDTVRLKPETMAIAAEWNVARSFVMRLTQSLIVQSVDDNTLRIHGSTLDWPRECFTKF
jgi:hypothetical protein